MISVMSKENAGYASELHAALGRHAAAAEALALASAHDAPSGQLAERNAAAAADLLAQAARLLFKLTATMQLLAAEVPPHRPMHAPPTPARRAYDAQRGLEIDPRMPPVDDYHATSGQEGMSS